MELNDFLIKKTKTEKTSNKTQMPLKTDVVTGPFPLPLGPRINVISLENPPWLPT